MMAGLPAKYIKLAKGDFAKAWRLYRSKKKKTSATKKKAKAPASAKRPKKKAAIKRKVATKKRAVAKRKTVKRKTPAMTPKRRTVARVRKYVSKSNPKRKTRKKTGTRKAGIMRAGNIQKQLTTVGMGMAGAVGANMAANLLPMPDPRLKAALPLIGGLVLMMSSGKNKMMEYAGLGMAIGGGLSTLKAVAPNIPFLAGEDLDDSYLPAPAEVEQALIEGEITAEEAQILREAGGMDGEIQSFAGEPLEFGGEWDEGEYFEMND
jgi:hypothetical protein